MIPGVLRSCGPLGAFAVLATLVTLVGGCRGGLGTTCRCAADCRAGLVCSAEGENPLANELCYKPGVSGLCIESDDVDDSGAPVELTEAPMYLDMPSKRDFQPSGSISDSMTGTTTASTGSTGSTGATMTGSSGTTDATTTEATGTSTSGTDTGTSGTGTSTGTTTLDTTTGTTGTTGDGTSTSSSSSGSSSGSSGSSSSTT